MPNVQVTFGANIQQLVDGVEGAKAAIQSFMAAFAVEKLADFADQYAKLGDQIETQEHQFGQSATAVQQLGYVAKMAGGDQQGLAESLGRLQLELQQAQNPTSRQAEALKALGLSAKQLIGLPLQQELGAIADAFAKYADGPNKAAIAQALFRNSSGEMIEMLDGGSAGMQRLYDQAVATGAVMSGQTVAALATLDRTTIGLRASLSALSGSLVALASSTLGSFANALATSAGNMSKLAQTGNLGSYTLAYMQAFAENLTAEIGKLAIAFTDLLPAMRPLAEFMSGNFISAGLDAAKLIEGGFGSMVARFKADMAGADKIIQATAEKTVADLDARLKQAAASYKALIAQTGAGNTGKPQMPAMDTNAGVQTSEMQSHYAGLIKQIEDRYALEKQLLSGDLAEHSKTYDQETAALLQALDARNAGEDLAYDAEIEAMKAAGKNYEAVVKQKIAADDKWRLQHEQITEGALKKDTTDWENALKPIESAWNSQLRAMLAGTENFRTAMKKILGDLVISGIEKMESGLVTSLSGSLAKAVGGPSSLFGSLLGGGGNSASTTANTTALTTLTASVTALNASLGVHTAATATSTAATATNATATTANTGGLFATAASWIGNTISTIANTAATDAAAIEHMFGFATGSWSVPHDMVAKIHKNEMIVPAEGGHADAMRALLGGFSFPKFDVGTNLVINSGLAMLHQNEAVVPAAARGSGPFTGGMGHQVNTSASFNISAMDSRSVARFFNDNRTHLMRAINGAMKSGAHIALRSQGLRI